MVIQGRLTPDDVPRICRSGFVLVGRSGSSELVCDLRELLTPDVALVDALARLHLIAKRAGCRLRVIGITDEVLELLELCGLEETLVRD